ncbi:hypothetical protein [Cetobacterium sp.]|uniref:hypothetical protein n=1 Tax=Cetobacterium sp. TaxID=2071632 RepID=UPI003EE55FF2
MLKIEKEIYQKILSNKNKENNFDAFFYEIENYVKNLKLNRNLNKILVEEKIEIIFDNKKNSFLRGKIEIENNSKKIFIYIETLKKAAKEGIFSLEELIEIVKAHEYFHYLEYSGKIDLEIVERKKSRWWDKKRAIDMDKLEILCHHYVKKLLDLSISPVILDYKNKEKI